MVEISNEFETWPDQIINLSYIPFIAEKVSDCHQHNLLSFDRIFLQLTDKVEMDEVLDEFENCPGQIIYFTVTIPWLLKMPIFNLIIGVTPSVLIRVSLTLHIK